MIKNVWHAFYLCHRKFCPMTQKTLRGIALRRSGRVSLKRPAADGESCEQDSISFGHLQLLVFQQVLVSHTGLAAHGLCLITVWNGDA